MKLLSLLAFSALTTAMTGGFGPQAATNDESPASKDRIERVSDRARRVVFASDLASYEGIAPDASGHAVLAAHLPKGGVWLQIAGDQVVRAGTGKPGPDRLNTATIQVKPRTLAVQKPTAPPDDFDLSGLLKDLDIEGLLADLPKDLGPLMGSIETMVAELTKDLDPIITDASELKALKQDGAKAQLSDSERKALEARIAALEKKLEAMAEKLSKRFDGFESKFDEKKFEEMGKRMAQRAEEMAKRLEKSTPKTGDPKVRARIESELKATIKDDRRRSEDAKKLAEEARALAEKVRQEVRVKLDDPEFKKAVEKIRVQVDADGKSPQVYTFTKSGKSDKAFIFDRPTGTMRPMTDEERKKAEALRREIMEKFTGKNLIGDGKDLADLEKRLGEIMKKRTSGEGPKAFVFGGTAKEFFADTNLPRLFVNGKGFSWLQKNPEGEDAPKVRFFSGEKLAPMPFDGSLFKNLLKERSGALDEKSLDALTKQLEEVRREIEKLREELRKKKDGERATGAPARFVQGRAVAWQAPEFKAFGKLPKGWQVPGSDAMAELFDTLTPEQVQRHEEQGYLSIMDLTPAQRRMLGEMDVLPWEIGLSLNGRKLSLRTDATASR